ncbi:MAG: MFS transporter [Chitinophagaceae bacterium]
MNFTTTTIKKNAFAALQLPEFRNLMLGRLFFIAALRMLGTLVLWWVYNLTHDALQVSLIGLAEFVPAFLLSLYAGHIIDKSEKKKVLLIAASSYIVAIVALLFIGILHTKNSISNAQLIQSIYVIIFITGICRAFSGPSFGTIVGLIPPKEIMSNAITWNQTTWLVASVTGHAIVGFLIVYFGIIDSLKIIIFFASFGLIMMSLIKKKPPILHNEKKNTLQSVTEGLQFVFKTKEVLGALMLDLFAVLFGGAVAMIPFFANDILKVGAKGFGWLNAATDIGTIISVALLTIFPMKTNQGKKLLFAVAGFGICIIVFALSKNFVLSFIAILLSGVLDGVSVVIRGVIVQLKTPNEMRGRVMSVNSMFINSSNELGQFESGLAAKYLGNIASVVFGGCMTLGIVIFTWFKAPKLRDMNY